jgi:hypothetical protein
VDKKQLQLGMNPGTATHRLVKDLLFRFAVECGHVCHRCKQALARDTFSIDHIEPWLDSVDPVRLFFDLNNVAFSHLKCNAAAGRKVGRGKTRYPQYLGRRRRASNYAHDARRIYDPTKRREQYLRTGQ